MKNEILMEGYTIKYLHTFEDGSIGETETIIFIPLVGRAKKSPGRNQAIAERMFKKEHPNDKIISTYLV